MNLNGYNNYKQQSVNTMTQSEMLLLLFDEILKRLTRAELALKDGNFTLFDESVKRCTEIVNYLINTLDLQFPISAELRRMYEYFIYEFGRLSASRKSSIIQEVKPLVLEMRNAFREAEKLQSSV